MINEDTLTLYYYDDGLSGEERRRIEAALQEDADLAERYRNLCLDLEQLRDTDTTAVPTHLLHRWHDSIDQAAREEKANSKPVRLAAVNSGRWHLSPFVWGGAITAALTIGIAIGVYISSDTVSIPDGGVAVAVVTEEPSLATPASFTRGLQLHLQESQWEIARLPISSPIDNTTLLMEIIQQNRMFERAATQNNSVKVARVLRAFEPILLRLASEDIAPEDAAALRAQLSFELNVMLTKLALDTSKESHSI